MKHFQTNTKVQWDWGDGSAEGYIREKFTDKVSKTLKGSEVTRNASEDDPAYLIEQSDGDEVLKSHSEIKPKS
jgi:hypothetical protein